MLQTLEAFLGYAADDFIIKTDSRPRLELVWRIFLPHSQRSLRALLAARSPSTQRPPIGPHKWRRNINLLSIVYAFRPRLRYRLTLGGFAFPRKP